MLGVASNSLIFASCWRRITASEFAGLPVICLNFPIFQKPLMACVGFFCWLLLASAGFFCWLLLASSWLLLASVGFSYKPTCHYKYSSTFEKNCCFLSQWNPFSKSLYAYFTKWILIKHCSYTRYCYFYHHFFKNYYECIIIQLL